MSGKLFDYRIICNDPTLDDPIDPRAIRGFNIPPDLGSFVCLTFDDGPTSLNTPKILDVLKAYNAKATFFVLGEFVEYFPQITLRIAEEGHEIGNHTFSHPELSELTAEQLKKEILDTEAAIELITKNRSRLFRPTYGVFRNCLLDQVENLGYKVVLWSRDMLIKDWEQPGAETLIERVVSNIKSGSNILLHDGGGEREQTIEALQSIIPLLTERGYQFVTVSEMIELSATTAKKESLIS
ncbi:polysaccharide deacetylase family protein [Paenibacillus sp. GCM10027627]|uniref:polysaccharide deacetylase family protein n=1 Tax=unclassified Paenibacillus TaxID=185978 RepID=UPI003625F94C